MSQINKQVLLEGNNAISEGNYESFLEFCTDDTVWEFVGDRTLHGKAEVLSYMAENYIEPPKFQVHELIAEDDKLIAVGEISLADGQGNSKSYHYCDVWEFRDGLLDKLRAFVIEKN